MTYPSGFRNSNRSISSNQTLYSSNLFNSFVHRKFANTIFSLRISCTVTIFRFSDLKYIIHEIYIVHFKALNSRIRIPVNNFILSSNNFLYFFDIINWNSFTLNSLSSIFNIGVANLFLPNISFLTAKLNMELNCPLIATSVPLV